MNVMSMSIFLVSHRHHILDIAFVGFVACCAPGGLFWCGRSSNQFVLSFCAMLVCGTPFPILFVLFVCLFVGCDVMHGLRSVLCVFVFVWGRIHTIVCTNSIQSFTLFPPSLPSNQCWRHGRSNWRYGGTLSSGITPNTN